MTMKMGLPHTRAESDHHRLTQSYTSKKVSHNFPLKNIHVNIDRDRASAPATVTIGRKKNDRVWLTRMKTDLEIELNTETNA